MSRFEEIREAPPPVLIDYRDLVRCSSRIDGAFEWQGWEEAVEEPGAETLFVHRRRLGCYRSARGNDTPYRGCSGIPFPFGDFLVTLETAIHEEGRDHRIESALQLLFFALRSERRHDLWTGQVALTSTRNGEVADLDLLAAAGVLNGPAILRGLRRRHDCRANPTCWQVAFSTSVLDAAMER